MHGRLKNLLIALLLALARTVAGEAPSDGEVKATFLMNIAEFVEWPKGAFAGPSAPITVGVIGEDPLDAELNKLDGKPVNGRRLEVKRFKGALEFRGDETPGKEVGELTDSRTRKLEELRCCHILLVGSSEKKLLPLIFKSVRGGSVLTVGDMGSFARQGGVIDFIKLDGKIHLEINRAVAEQAGLKISSKLLNLARVIEGGHEAE